MTDEGFARTWECYGPLVAEGNELLAGLTTTQLAQMREHLDAIRELTDRHRARLLGGVRGPQSAEGPCSSSTSKPASSSTGTPSDSALSALVPALSPTTT